MVDLVSLALIIAIVIILMMLTNCWGLMDDDCDGVKEGLSPLANFKTNDNTGQFYSDTGSGLINDQLAAQYADLENLKQYGSYNELSQYMSLEPDVYKSHQEYSTDINRSTSGASMMTIRSDPNDVNPWRGLRRIDYKSIYPQDDVRTDSSEVPDQMETATHYLI